MAFVSYATKTPLSELKRMEVQEFNYWYKKLVEIHNKLTPSEKDG